MKKPELQILAAVLFAVGAVAGIVFADLLWQAMHPRGLGRFNPVRDGNYYLMAIACAIATGTLAVCLVGFRSLPNGSDSDGRP